VHRRSRTDVERINAAHRAAHLAGEAVARWWKALGDDPTDRPAIDTALKDALAVIKDTLQADAVALLLSEENGDELVARAAVGLSEEVTTGMRIRAGQGMAGQVTATRKPLLVEELSEIDVVTPVLRNSGLHSIVAVPMLSGDRLFGVLYAGSYTPSRFVEEDADILSTLAGRVANSLDRVRLYENERRAREVAERAVGRVSRMQRITSLLARATTEAEVTEVFNTKVAAEIAEGPGPLSRVRLVRGAQLEEPVYTSGIEKSALAMDLWDPASDADLGSQAAIPVVVGESCVAIIAVACEGAHNFEPEERAFLEAVGAQTNQAFERAGLYSKQRELAEVASFLARAARVTAEASDLTETLERLGTLALEVLGDVCLIDIAAERGSIKRVVALHRDPDKQYLVDRLRTEFAPDPSGNHPAAAVMRTGEVLWSPDMDDGFMRSTTHDEEHLDLTMQLGFRSFVAVPLASDGETLGSLTLVSCTRRLGVSDVTFAQALAQQVSAVVANARQYDTTSRISRILQSSLLPQRLPEVPGLEVHTLYLPATRGLEIGGDFYDLVPLGDGRVWFSIGDVAGHDSWAAAMMGHLRSAVRALIATTSSPSELVESLESSWDLLGFERIATAIFGVLDMNDGCVRIASAGHYPPLVASTGTAKFLELKPSPPLGVEESVVKEWSGTMGVGDVMVLYTDGAVDERNLGSETSMRLIADAAAGGPLSPAEVCERIVGQLDPERIDDIAMMALQRTGSVEQD
jgi:GAF domain-containing protein